MEQNILEVIRTRIPEMSKNQKKIAHYIIDNLEDAAFATAAQIGKAVDVSESTVVRFAGAVGYSGFPELQSELAFALKNKIKSINRIDIKHSMSHSKILDYVLKSDADKITATLDEIDVDAFNLAVELISNAKTVYVVGVRTAGPLADILSFYLKMVAKNVITVNSNSSSEIFEQMLSVCEEDVVIGISFPRYSMRTLKAMEFANDRNARIIAITDSIHSPMNLYSSCNLFAKSELATVVDSFVAPLSLINALIVALCIDNSEEVVKRLETLSDVWDNYQVNNSDEINYLDKNIMNDLKGLKD